MKILYFLVSESTIGTHLNCNEENVIFVEMKIPMNVKNLNNEFINNTSLSDNKNFQLLVEGFNFYKNQYDEIYVLVGFDADIQGEYMANTLRDELIFFGIDKNKIIRMPFCGDNYFALSDFMNIRDYINYKGLEDKFLKFLKKHNSKNEQKVELMSFRKIISLLELNANKGKDFSVRQDGTNTFTYITNCLYKNSIASKEGLQKWIVE